MERLPKAWRTKSPKPYPNPRTNEVSLLEGSSLLCVIYYFHHTQRLPWHFTEGDDFCGMRGDKTTVAQGAHRARLWARASTQGAVGKLEQQPNVLLQVSGCRGRPQTSHPTGSAYSFLACGWPVCAWRGASAESLTKGGGFHTARGTASAPCASRLPAVAMNHEARQAPRSMNQGRNREQQQRGGLNL